MEKLFHLEKMFFKAVLKDLKKKERWAEYAEYLDKG